MKCSIKTHHQYQSPLFVLNTTIGNTELCFTQNSKNNLNVNFLLSSWCLNCAIYIEFLLFYLWNVTLIVLSTMFHLLPSLKSIKSILSIVSPILCRMYFTRQVYGVVDDSALKLNKGEGFTTTINATITSMETSIVLRRSQMSIRFQVWTV